MHIHDQSLYIIDGAELKLPPQPRSSSSSSDGILGSVLTETLIVETYLFGRSSDEDVQDYSDGYDHGDDNGSCIISDAGNDGGCE